MKKIRGLSLNIKLLASFAAAIFVLSAFHFAIYSNLLNTLAKETQTSTDERLGAAITRLDESLAHIRNSYFSFTYAPSFKTAASYGNPSEYEMLDLFNSSGDYLGSNPNISGYVILFSNNNNVVSSGGNYTDKEFFEKCYSADEYTAEFWQKEKQEAFSQKYYPAANFTLFSRTFSTQHTFLPVAFKPYWNSNIMVVLFLNAAEICKAADKYLTQDFYIIGKDDKTIYSTEANYSAEEAASAAMPTTAEDGNYIVTRKSVHGDFTYKKLLQKNAVVGQLSSIRLFTFAMAASALFIGLGIAVFFVIKLLRPMHEILRLFSSEDALSRQQVNELNYIQENVEAMLRQREQYVKQLSKKDAALSGFLLQSQLKNIYVDLDSPNQTMLAQNLKFYIIYFRIHYRLGTLDDISAEPSALEHVLLEHMRHILNQLFNTALIFQLEPTQFVAKVSVENADNSISQQMDILMQSLENESEFAFFTVVQSNSANANGNFTDLYDEVLDAAQYAIVNNTTQLILLPLKNKTANSFSFPTENEQQLIALVREGRAQEATALAQRVLERNLCSGILRIHMILLCSSIISASMRALSDINLTQAEAQVNSSSVYNMLNHCDIDRDYIKLVTDFVNTSALCVSMYADAQDKIVEGVKLFLEKNYAKEFSMDELSEALHLSKSYLSTYYKSKTGANLSDYIQYFRIQKAVMLLADANLKIGDIGAMVGISNINTFLRQFKKYTGMTPKEYRIKKLSI